MAKKSWEKDVESGRERAIRQSQTGSKYDKKVYDHGISKGFSAKKAGQKASGVSDTGKLSGATEEYKRKERIRKGTTTEEDKRQMQAIADKTGKNPYGVQTEGGITTIDSERKAGSDKEKKESWLKRLNILGPSIKDPLERKKLELIKRAIENWQGNMPDYGFGELLAQTMGNFAMGRYKKLLGAEELYRDDDLGMWTGSGPDEVQYPGSFTAEGLDDFIRSIDPEANILGQLERHHGDIYYSFNDPQTTGGITDLAGKAALQKNEDGKYTAADGRIISKEAGEKYNNQIFAARQNLDRMDRDIFGNRRTGLQEGGEGVSGGGGTGTDTGTGTGTSTGTGTGTGTGAGNQFAVAPEGKIGYTPDTLGTIDPVTGKPIGYQWGSLADYTPQTQVNLTDMSYYNPLEAYEGFNPLAGYVYNDGGIVQLGHGGYLDDYAAADSLMFKDPQDEEEWEYNV